MTCIEMESFLVSRGSSVEYLYGQLSRLPSWLLVLVFSIVIKMCTVLYSFWWVRLENGRLIIFFLLSFLITLICFSVEYLYLLDHCVTSVLMTWIFGIILCSRGSSVEYLYGQLSRLPSWLLVLIFSIIIKFVPFSILSDAYALRMGASSFSPSSPSLLPFFVSPLSIFTVNWAALRTGRAAPTCFNLTLSAEPTPLVPAHFLSTHILKVSYVCHARLAWRALPICT